MTRTTSRSFQEIYPLPRNEGDLGTPDNVPLTEASEVRIRIVLRIGGRDHGQTRKDGLAIILFCITQVMESEDLTELLVGTICSKERRRVIDAPVHLKRTRRTGRGRCSSTVTSNAAHGTVALDCSAPMPFENPE